MYCGNYYNNEICEKLLSFKEYYNKHLGRDIFWFLRSPIEKALKNSLFPATINYKSIFSKEISKIQCYYRYFFSKPVSISETKKFNIYRVINVLNAGNFIQISLHNLQSYQYFTINISPYKLNLIPRINETLIKLSLKSENIDFITPLGIPITIDAEDSLKAIFKSIGMQEMALDTYSLTLSSSPFSIGSIMMIVLMLNIFSIPIFLSSKKIALSLAGDFLRKFNYEIRSCWNSYEPGLGSIFWLHLKNKNIDIFSKIHIYSTNYDKAACSAYKNSSFMDFLKNIYSDLYYIYFFGYIPELWENKILC